MGKEKNQQYSQPDRAAVRAQVKHGDGWQTGGNANTLRFEKPF